jgi:hypothetical protein
MRIITTLLSLVFLSLTVEQTQAFPTFMGVYDHFLRHDGKNPGRFTILMNQSYVGLEASVGIRVNDGTWTEYPMSYVTDVDGNSQWEYVPAQPFPFGATVEFYFHGYDVNTLENIYDSRGTLNYFSGPLYWNTPEVLPMFSVYPGNFLMSSVYASGGEILYVAAAYSGTSTNFSFSHKIPGHEWSSAYGPGEDSAINEFSLAANGASVLVAYRLDTNLFARLSGDKGVTWSAPAFLATVPANGSLSGISASAGPDSSFAVAFGIATNCCGAQNIFVTVLTNGANSWNAPSPALQFANLAYASSFKFTGNGNGWYMTAKEVPGSGSSAMHGGFSSNGINWTTQNLGGNVAWSEATIAASASEVLIAADPYYDSATYTWKLQPDASWSTQKIDRALEGGSTVWLGHDGGTTWYLYRYEDNDSSPSFATMLPTFRVSTNSGSSWSYQKAVHYTKPGSNDFVSLNRVISSAGPKQYLIWTFNEYVNIFTRMYSYRLQETDGLTESLSITPMENGLITLDAAGLTPGMSHTLQQALAPDSPTWTDVTSWSYGSTNVVINPDPTSSSTVYRVKSSH